MNLSNVDLARLLALIGKIKVERNPYMPRLEKEIRKQAMDDCKEQIERNERIKPSK